MAGLRRPVLPWGAFGGTAKAVLSANLISRLCAAKVRFEPILSVAATQKTN
ncbi:hypothetical protein SAMN05421665_0981 [Yoonia rosea]|uniref:Uncharacterized protein n=1 Tax=Yoonia rosea TaxID=287098 RepID=A0A1R3WNH2_9RHOB|nr:hypothetical protein SAMN05421665_0981 [Yoonia rosea]